MTVTLEAKIAAETTADLTAAQTEAMKLATEAKQAGDLRSLALNLAVIADIDTELAKRGAVTLAQRIASHLAQR